MTTNKKYYIWIGLILFLGLFFRLFTSRFQPLCLDEKYSIFYATQFSHNSLLKNFSVDAHPGFYYSLLKNLLYTTNNKIILRFFSSVVPQIIGTLILILFLFRSDKKKDALFLSAIFMFNPFFNHLSFQLRSYSLVFFMTIVAYILVCIWQEKRKAIYLFLLFLILLISNLTHYVMYVFSFFVLTFVSLKMRSKISKKILFLFLTSILLIFQFFFFNNCSSIGQYKEQFQEAGWISLPSFSNIPKVYLTSLGMDVDIMNTARDNLFFSGFIFYLTVGLLAFLFFTRKKKDVSFLQRFFVLSLFPMLTILFLSFFLPFLSHRLFINQLIPRISLFIPRIQLPFVTIFWILVIEKLSCYFDSIQNKKKIGLFMFTLFILFIYWILLNLKLNMQPFCENKNQETLNAVLDNRRSENKLYLWPHWMWIEAIQLGDLSNVSSIFKLKDESEKFEKSLFSENHRLECNLIDHADFYLYTETVFSQDELQKNIGILLDKCCIKKEGVGSFESWDCSN